MGAALSRSDGESQFGGPEPWLDVLRWPEILWGGIWRNEREEIPGACERTGMEEVVGMATREWEKVRGLMAATFTPMNDDGSVRLDGVDVQARHLAATGICGAFICGTAGESMSLTVKERMLLAERWVSAGAANELKVLVHVGHQCLADARALASHAQEIAAWGVSALVPSFFRPSTVSTTIEWCGRIAAEAPTLPFYYYHFPDMTGVDMRVSHILSEGCGSIPNLAGAKYTSFDLVDLSRCLKLEGGAFDILLGREELLVAGLTMGCKGAIGSTFSFSAPLALGIVDALARGEVGVANRLQAALLAIVDTFRKYGGIEAQKAVMWIMGLDCGGPRLPMKPLNGSDRADLRRDLGQLGFFEMAQLVRASAYSNHRGGFG